MAEAAKNYDLSLKGTEAQRETELAGVLYPLRDSGASQELALSIMNHWLSNEGKAGGLNEV